MLTFIALAVASFAAGVAVGYAAVWTVNHIVDRRTRRALQARVGTFLDNVPPPLRCPSCLLLRIPENPGQPWPPCPACGIADYPIPMTDRDLDRHLEDRTDDPMAWAKADDDHDPPAEIRFSPQAAAFATAHGAGPVTLDTTEHHLCPDPNHTSRFLLERPTPHDIGRVDADAVVMVCQTCGHREYPTLVDPDDAPPAIRDLINRLELPRDDD